MLARLRVRLPFSLQVPVDNPLRPQERTFAGYRVRYYPPLPAAIPPIDRNSTFERVADALEPTATPSPRSDLTVDKKPAFDGEIVQIDFLDRDFDRREGADDPPTEVLIRAATDWVARVRHITRAGHARLPAQFPWRLEYLNDDGTQLERSAGFVRARGGTNWEMGFTLVTPDVWRLVTDLADDWVLPIWDELLLDADATRDVGPKVVLAYAALEVFITLTLAELAKRSTTDPELWAWVTNRGNYLKDPAVEEEFDVLLRVLNGRSLKSAPDNLWGKFTELRTARNRFAHEGRATVGADSVDFPRAVSLVAGAIQIITWVEDQLPSDMRRLRATELHNVELTQMLSAPRQAPSSSTQPPKSDSTSAG
jgi:hypothetical protein